MTVRSKGFTSSPPNVPVVDNPYPQKHVSVIALPGGRHANDVRALAVDSGNRVLCATAWGLFAVRQEFATTEPLGELPPEWTPPVEVGRLEEGLPSLDVKEVRTDGSGAVWAATLDGVARLEGDRWQALWSDTVERFGAVMSVWPDESDLWVVTSHRGFGRVKKGQWKPIALPPELGRALRIDPATSGVWVSASAGAAWILPDGSCCMTLNTGCQVRRVVHRGAIYLATGRGLTMVGPGGVVGDIDPSTVPVSDIHDLLLVGDKELWAATSRGVWRRVRGEERVHYYHGRRYLPHPFCRALARKDPGSVWVATANGIAHLAELPQTLAQKAQRFEYRVRKRHQRLDGYVTSSRLTRAGDLSTNEPQPSDNDGLWTAMYLAAQCYRYAITKDEEARQFASQAFQAMERLEAVTTIPGFPTKAIIHSDDPVQHQTRMPWLPSADGKWLWKADCSSDEIVGHMYGYSLYYDLAADPSEKQRVVELVVRIMDHIVDNGYYIIGPDGEHTQWGVWAPELLNGPWRSQQGLNSLEILSHLRAAYHITRQDRYIKAYHHLIEEHHYAENTRRQKIDVPGHVNHSDDELAFLSYYPLLKYEDQPDLRAIYIESLEHNWQIERPERNPLWNMIYGVLTGNVCDIADSVRSLREIPMDLITWGIDNSGRRDIAFDVESGRFGELQTVEVLPLDELPIAKWNSNPYRAVDGGNGHSEDDGTYYLLPYWMGRYYGLIQ